MSKNKRNRKITKVNQKTKPNPQRGNKRLMLAIIFSLAILTTAIILFKDENKQVVIPKDFPTLAIREQARIKIFTAMDEIVEKSRDQQAQKVRDWIKANYLLAIPFKDTGKSIRYYLFRDGKLITKKGQYPKHGFMYIIVLPEDIKPKLSRDLDNYTVYDPPNRSIYFNFNRLEKDSLTSIAFTFLHEGFHAWDHYHSNYPLNKNWEDMMENEREAYIFETDLLVAYLGMPARKLTFDMAQQINFKVTPDNKGNYIFDMNDRCEPESFETELKQIIWSSAKEGEIHRFTALCKLYAMLNKLRLQYPQMDPVDMATLQRGIIAHFHQQEIQLKPME